MITRLLLVTLALPLAPAGEAQEVAPLPIIDMHLHAVLVSEFVGPEGAPMEVCAGDQEIEFPGVDPGQPITLDAVVECPQPLPSITSEEELIEATVEILERRNIWALTSGRAGELGRLHEAAPRRILRAFDFLSEDGSLRVLDELRELVANGRVAAFAEVAPQYLGLAPNDPALELYFAFAEELDTPVGLHLGEGPPGGAHVLGGFATPSPYRVAAGNPLLLEDVLIRHPKLRIWVMHFGSPFVDEMIAMLYSHPQLYVDIAQNNWGFPRKEFYLHLRRLVGASFAKRILFGSDQMVWPETIEIAIESIESAEFLTDEQKRDIFYNNAARFLRLSDEEIGTHHGK